METSATHWDRPKNQRWNRPSSRLLRAQLIYLNDHMRLAAHEGCRYHRLRWVLTSGWPASFRWTIPTTPVAPARITTVPLCGAALSPSRQSSRGHGPGNPCDHFSWVAWRTGVRRCTLYCDDVHCFVDESATRWQTLRSRRRY